MRELAAGLLLLALLDPVRAAAPALPADADRLLWCASAFFWLAGSADDAGDVAEAELYDGWAGSLGDRAAALLGELGFDAAHVEETVAAYDQQVLDEITAGSPRHEVAACQQLVAP
ncbi:hypothetical protein [Devosia sp.]|uniref:hypothetical protein n=1 Tax=Devosia sp. TaxID=1871048 RepID=UPI002EEFFD34